MIHLAGEEGNPPFLFQAQTPYYYASPLPLLLPLLSPLPTLPLLLCESNILPTPKSGSNPLSGEDAVMVAAASGLCAIW